MGGKSSKNSRHDSPTLAGRKDGLDGPKKSPSINNLAAPSGKHATTGSLGSAAGASASKNGSPGGKSQAAGSLRSFANGAGTQQGGDRSSSGTVAIEASASQYKALYAYDSNGKNELSFLEGDVFDVLEQKDPHWWGAVNIRTGARGMIPSNYVAPGMSLEQNAWFHGKISRTAAEYLLNSGINGSYLIRESESNPGDFSISVKYDGKMYHYRVSREGGMLFVAPEHTFGSIEELVKHHCKNADGLVAPLKHPVLKKDRPAVPGLAYGTTDTWEIDKGVIKLGRKLGAGQYGDVYEGYFNDTVHVAVKTLKEENMEVKDFLAEAAIMKKLKHPNLVQLLGVCTREAPFYIVTEFMPKGNLLEYLRGEEGKMLNAHDLMYMADQVAGGMEYLESQSFIHRDLAARNCLVGYNNLVRIADFGLSRIVEDEYTAREGAKFPIKWTAPESLQYNKFTTQSDVWAYGVLLWELATYGETPYPGVELSQVLDKLESGYRMPKPVGCPDEIYGLMVDCWKWNANERPTFKTIKFRVNSLFQGANVNDVVHNTLQREAPTDNYAMPASRGGAPLPPGSAPPALPPKPSQLRGGPPTPTSSAGSTTPPLPNKPKPPTSAKPSIVGRH